MIVNQKYRVTYNIEENRIFIRLTSGEKVKKKIQVYSIAKEFPFLYAGSVELSSEYDVWVAPAVGNTIPDWRTCGFTIRILNETSIEDEITIEISNGKTRVLFVSPHLSTGGCPQYLLKKIQTYRDELDIYVVEHGFLSSAYVVQRNKIIDIIGENKFFSLGEDKSEICSIIDTVRPDIIHFEEIPETFMPHEIIDKIYTKKDRKYFITETTHSSFSKPSQKYFLPDKYIFCSKYSQESFKSLNVPSEIWEYPIEDNIRPNRKEALKKLGLKSKFIHVLNVGLFTPGKNQGEIFEIAKKFEGENVQFHFVGNQAQNFEDYWGPLMINKPENCIIWGERSDVESFMQACDLFYFSSILELNPLVIKEALSWKMPVLMYDLATYMQTYTSNSRVTFLDNSRIIDANEKLLRDVINKKVKPLLDSEVKRCKIVHIVSELTTEIERTSIASVSALGKVSPSIEYTIHYNVPMKTIPEGMRTLYGEQDSKHLKAGHFGCFEAFRKAIIEDFTDDFDFVVVCERDCLLEKDPNEVYELMKRTFRLMENEDITYFSFGDKVDLDRGYIQSMKISDLPGGFSYLTGKIIGLQFIIFSRDGRDFLREQFKTKGWHGMDIWLSEIYSQSRMKMGILNDRVTTQLDGYSIIDETFKTFEANKK